ncbi:MAG: DUF4124 domain-containing protein [Betaproteobacteria bacterium]|nr:MAG: DUF4124 domain-containing protein [Betaproteobacteria bacterium]
MCVSVKRLAAMLCFVAAALLVSISASAEIQKWVDRKGHVHYGDRPPSWANSTPVVVRPNVIETGPVAQPAPALKRPAAPRERASPVSAPRARPDIQAYIEQCRNNRGVYCEWEARAMIDGPATVLFPGDPLIFRRPDLRPAPPAPPRPVPERL